MILFHDVDGCLNAEDGIQLPMDNRDYNPLQRQRLSELGILLDQSPVRWLAINTGRSLADTETLVPLINSGKLRYLVVEHGALIVDLLTESTVEWTGSAASKLAEIQLLVNWFNDEGLHHFSRRIGHELRTLDKISNLTIAIPDAVDDQHLFGELRAFVHEASPFNAEDYVYHYSGSDSFVDIMSSVHKGDGVQRIMELTDGEQSIAVGNGLNDLPMMEIADLCVCPANSEPELIECVQRRNGIVGQTNYIRTTLDWLGTLS